MKIVILQSLENLLTIKVEEIKNELTAIDE